MDVCKIKIQWTIHQKSHLWPVWASVPAAKGCRHVILAIETEINELISFCSPVTALTCSVGVKSSLEEVKKDEKMCIN